MRKALIKRNIEEEYFDTRQYRYAQFGSIGELIKRTPLDRVEYPDAWKVVHGLIKEIEVNTMKFNLDVRVLEEKTLMHYTVSIE